MAEKNVNAVKKGIDTFINLYEEVIYGCGYNIGGEARRKAKMREEKESINAKTRRREKDTITIGELLKLKKAG